MSRSTTSASAIVWHRVISSVRGLALSCHPLPTVAVSVIAAGLAALAGLAPGRTLLLVGAVFTGQLSIGWSNDWIDAGRDRAVGRRDKPLASGQIEAAAVAIAAAMALAATVGLSIWLGFWAGAAALTIVACGWAYNLGLKSTVFSWLPYALAFGLLPATATLALPGGPWPGVWAMAAGALLGVGAHFANVLPDLRSDAMTGVRGLPHRLGASNTVLGVPILLSIASGVILLGPGAQTAWRWAMVGVVVAVAALGAALGFHRPETKVLLITTILIAIADVALFALSGAALT